MNIFDSRPYHMDHMIWSILLFCFHMSLISEGIRIIRDTKGFTYVMYLSRRFFFFIQKINSNANGHLTKKKILIIHENKYGNKVRLICSGQCGRSQDVSFIKKTTGFRGTVYLGPSSFIQSSNPDGTSTFFRENSF